MPTAFYDMPLSSFLPKTHPYCIYKKHIYSINIEQIEDFIKRMNEPQNKEIPYFAIKWHNYYFHDYASIPENYDKMLKLTLEKFKSNFKDTMLVINSDHGGRFTQYSQTKNGIIEHTNPFLSIKLPNKLKNTKFYENFASNKNK